MISTVTGLIIHPTYPLLTNLTYVCLLGYSFLRVRCNVAVVIPGPADIEISDVEQLAFISSDDRSWVKESSFFHRPSRKTTHNGGIYTLPLNQKTSTPKEAKLKDFASEDFHPTGMSLYRFQDPDSHVWVDRLFVINHSHKGDIVEIFDYAPKSNTLTHVKSVQSSLFVTPKDIVAVDKDRFYLTNHHVSETSEMCAMRTFFSSVAVCLIQDWRIG